MMRLVWAVQIFFGIVWRKKADGTRMTIGHALETTLAVVRRR
jgi:hypothetical protein